MEHCHVLTQFIISGRDLETDIYDQYHRNKSVKDSFGGNGCMFDLLAVTFQPSKIPI